MARPSLFQHRKFRTLSRRLGSRAVAAGSLELLWAVANDAGDPLIGAAEDVEDVADWHGEPGALVAALVACRFLDETADGYLVHDHAHHCPTYVQKRRQREEQRRTHGYSRDRNGLPYATVDLVFSRERKCAQCGSTDRLEIDHIIPKAAGGGNEPENLQLLCMSCNKKKGAKNRLLVPGRTVVDSSDQSLMSKRTAVTPTPISHLPSPNKKERTERPAPAATGFAVFWDAYPKKVDKGHAETAWKALKPSQALQALIVAAVLAQRQWPAWTKDGGKYIPNPATWLRGKRWDDDPPDAPALAVVKASRWCPHEPECRSVTACRDRTIAEAREARESA